MTHIFLCKVYKTFLLPHSPRELWHYVTLPANSHTNQSTFSQFYPSSIGWQENYPQLMLNDIPHQKWWKPY